MENVNALTKALCAQRRLGAALRVHDEAQRHGFEPDENTYVALL